MKTASFWILVLATIVLVGAIGGHRAKSDPSRPLPDGPGAAFEWRRLAWLDENGQFDREDYLRALDQREENIEFSRSQGDLGIQSVAWTERGPTNVAGRTRSLAIHPTNASLLLAGSVSGGIWRSTDGGATWSAVDDRLKSLAIGCIVFHPTNPDIVFAGTGEGQFNGDAIGGVGIYKSIDAGLTFALIPGTSGWDNVCRLAIAPNGNTILAGRRYGGIMRSTDGGATWTNPYWAQGSFDVEFHPTDSSKAVAHVIDYDWSVGNWFHRALYSTNGGASWSVAAGLNQVFDFGNRIDLAYARSSPSIVYASCAADSGKIWKSTDGGQSYVAVTSSGGSGVSWYTNPLWVDPTNPQNLVTGGYHLFRSIDGGVNLGQISNGYIQTTQPHPDEHFAVSSPGFNGVLDRRVYICNDGGVYRTDNIYGASTSAGWTRLDRGMRTTQFYGAQGDGPTGRIIGGTQDNGTLRLINGTNDANLMFGGDGGFCAIDRTNVNYCYGEYIYLMIHRSTNGGVSSDWIYSTIGDANSNANFIAPFILDPNDANRMLAGGASLWRSNNVKAASPTFSAIRGPGSSVLSAIAVAPGNSDIIWIGQNNGEVWKTTNGTAASPTWTAVDNNTGPNPFPTRYVTRIVVDPANPNIVYVTLGGFSPDNLWKTTNGGTTWADITGSGVSGLPDATIRGFARHPQMPNWLYAGTEVGLFESRNGGATWSTNEFGPANVSVDEVSFMHNSNTLLVATHGRGIWTANIPSLAGPVRSAVTLQDWSVTHAGQSVRMEVTTPGSETPLTIANVSLVAGGTYSFDPNVQPGTYDLYAKHGHFLRRRLGSVTLSISGATGQNFTLKNGDVDGDNEVGISDFALLSNAYNSTPADPNFNASADLNGDSEVGVGDYAILSSNFGLVGD